MRNLVPDALRHAGRALRRSPGFTAAALLAVALGIGPNVALFSLVDALLLRPLPVPDAERLVRVYPGSETVSYPDYLFYRDHAEAFSGLAVENGVRLVLDDGERPQRILGAIVSGNYFAVLGVEPELGRAFLPEEDRTPDSHPVAVISHAAWQRRLGGRPDVVGSTLRLDRRRFTVVGVAPPGFTGTTLGQEPEVWVPTMMQPTVWPGRDRLSRRTLNGLSLIGRLAPGVTVDRARAETGSLRQRLLERFPDALEGWDRVVVEPAGLLHHEMRTPVAAFASLLAGVVGLVLLIACGNFANLLLARGAGRRREIAVRRALGAGRGRIVGLLLAENLLLALAGGLLGLLLAELLFPLVVRSQLSVLPVSVFLDLGLDVRVLAFTLALSLVTGAAAGLLPALRAARGDLTPALKAGSGGSAGRSARRSGPRNLLVVAQVGFSLLLLVAAGLFLRSLMRAQQVDPGFDVDHSLVATVDPASAGYGEADRRAYLERLAARVRALPGVEAAGYAAIVPLSLDNLSLALRVDGEERGQTCFNYVGPGYFAATGIDLVRGRGFTADDVSGAPPVAVVNRAFADAYLAHRDPLGREVQQLDFEGPSPLYRIVGLVDNSKYLTLGEEDRPLLYLAAAQHPAGELHLHVRVDGDPRAAYGAIDEAMRQVDRDVPVDLRTTAESLGVALLLPRLGALLLGGFGLVGLLLTLLGIYGLLSHLVAGRRREIGIRMAVGGDRRRIVALVVGQGLRLAAFGVAAGLLVAVLASRLLAGLLYGIGPLDPAVFAAVPLLLLAAAAAAALVPARRAARADPAEVLRGD